MTDPIRAKIIELVPEIMETTFGCRVLMTSKEGTQYSTRVIDRWMEPDKTYWYKVVGHNGQNWEIEDFDEILGHPIQLADVLRAIDRSGEEILIGQKGEIYQLYGQPQERYTGYVWNLALDFDNQEQPTKDFIGRLLGVTN